MSIWNCILTEEEQGGNHPAVQFASKIDWKMEFLREE